MAVTKHQAEALAELVAGCRPYGAPRWDKAGIVAAIGQVRHSPLPDVVMAMIRAATDPDARTPACITNTRSQHWRERVGEAEPYRPPRRDEVCLDCNQRIERCACGSRRQRPVETSDLADEHIRSLRGIYRTAVADLCKHGPACRDCQPAPEPPHDLPESEDHHG